MTTHTRHARPLLKWPGGKTQILSTILTHVPPLPPGSRYFEPFFGGGAVFFALNPERAVVSDLNYDLISVYRAVRDRGGDVIPHLAALERDHKKASKETYYAVREAYNGEPEADEALRAARFIYLNRTCFNGLYRVNKKGHFNVPIGSYKNPTILMADRLASASVMLQRSRIEHADFAAMCRLTQRGDFVYLDPPYQPISQTSGFTAFTPGGFDAFEQARLAEAVTDMANRGVRILLSNSDTDYTRSLYGSFSIVSIQGRRSINSKAGGRGPIPEILVRAGY